MLSRRVLLVSANRELLPSPAVPLGLLWVAGGLRARGHQVQLTDLCFEGEPDLALRRSIAAFAPDVVGIGLRNLRTNSAATTGALLGTYAQLVRAARSATGAPIVLGGAGFSLRPETLLHDLGADHGVVGEGEFAMPRLVEALASGERVERLIRAGLVGDGRATRPEAASLEALPAPARDLVDPRYYAFDGVANVQTKRGCQFACAYCDYPDLEGHLVRLRDPAAVAEELLRCAHTPGVSHAFVVDSVFNVPRGHALAVCEEFVKRGSPLPWVCYVSPVGLDDDLVRAMARAGCVGAEIGSDAGTDRLLARLRKPFRLADIERAHRLFRAHGLHDCHTFILGAMDETPAESRETLAFASRLDPDVAVFMVFVEDREDHPPEAQGPRAEILRWLALEAPRHPGWSVPELGIRFGDKLTRYVRRTGLRGPAWLHLARARREHLAPIAPG